MHRWGEIFPLGGIGGLPLTGKTGWAAFSSHAPQDGNIVVLFAPHVGVDCEGNVGKVHRHGIDSVTSACGAAIASYNAIKEDKAMGDLKGSFHDFGINVIKHLLVDHVDDILSQEDEMVGLAYKMYAIVEKYLDDIVNMNFAGPRSKLAIVGGIMINCDGNRNDLFLPLKFEVRSKTDIQNYSFECFGFQNSELFAHTSFIENTKKS